MTNPADLPDDIDFLKAMILASKADTAWPTAFAYYAVALDETFKRPAVSALVEWLKKDLR